MPSILIHPAIMPPIYPLSWLHPRWCSTMKYHYMPQQLSYHLPYQLQPLQILPLRLVSHACNSLSQSSPQWNTSICLYQQPPGSWTKLPWWPGVTHVCTYISALWYPSLVLSQQGRCPQSKAQGPQFVNSTRAQANNSCQAVMQPTQLSRAIQDALVHPHACLFRDSQLWLLTLIASGCNLPTAQWISTHHHTWAPYRTSPRSWMRQYCLPWPTPTPHSSSSCSSSHSFPFRFPGGESCLSLWCCHADDIYLGLASHLFVPDICVLCYTDICPCPVVAWGPYCKRIPYTLLFIYVALFQFLFTTVAM